MRDPVRPMTPEQADARRRSVRRTAWAVALVALGIYVVFLLAGILGQ